MKNDDLPVVDVLYVWPRLRRQHRECFGLSVAAGPPDRSNRHEWRAYKRKAVFRFRVFPPSMLKKRGRWNKTPVAFAEMFSARSKVEDRATRPRGRKPELHLLELQYIVARSTDDRCHLADLNVAGGRQIHIRLPRRATKREILHHLAVVCVHDLLFVLAAHSGSLRAWRGVNVGNLRDALFCFSITVGD